MLVKVYCLVLVLNVCSAASTYNNTLFNSEDRQHPELPCTSIGGTCAKSGSCPKNTRANIKGMCPLQQEDGIECCIKAKGTIVKRREMKCSSRGGECISSSFQCPEMLTFRDATDCGTDQKCCIFVK